MEKMLKSDFKIKFDQKREIWYVIKTKDELTKNYTNHSIQVTSIIVLTRMRFFSSEIISFSGHKSIQSLSNYRQTQPK